MIFRHGGRQREMGLGSATVVSLADARRKRDEIRRILADGRDPIAERRGAKAAPAKAVTFGAFADTLVPELAKGFRNAKHAAQWTSTLAAYAAPLRSKPVSEIATDDVLAVLQPIWTTKTETASRVRGRIEHILDAAKTRGLRTGENPSRWRGNLQHLLPKRRKLTRGHHAAMPYGEVPAFVATLRARKAVSSLALETLILTAARVGEIVGMEWDEVDLKAKLWTVPAGRMKAERDHRVPLSDRAVAILTEMAAIRRGPFVFDGHRADRHMSTGAFDALLERMKVPYTAHGFRSSFRDWAGDCTDFPREVAEAALAHAVGDKAEQAYRRGDALQKRRQIMEAWGGYISVVCRSPS
jgi:integrase